MQLVDLEPGNAGLVTPLHQRLGLGGADRLQSLLASSRARGVCVLDYAGVLGYATARPWFGRTDLVAVRLTLAREIPSCYLPGLVAAVLSGSGYARALLFPVKPEHVAQLEEAGWTKFEELIAYVREPAPLEPARPACEVRPFVPGDLPAVLEVEHSAFPELWWAPPGDFLAMAQQSGCTFLVGEKGGSLVGYCSTFWGPGRPGQVGRLGVHGAHQGRGIGGWLLHQGLVPLAGARVHLNTQVWNDASRHLYERFGFRVEDTTWMMERKLDHAAC